MIRICIKLGGRDIDPIGRNVLAICGWGGFRTHSFREAAVPKLILFHVPDALARLAEAL